MSETITAKARRTAARAARSMPDEASDAIPLETTGASISFHQYAKMAWREPFTEIEAVFRAGEGRPHWAKRHTLTAADVHRLYPRTADYLAVREAVDPGQKFANARLTRLFGLSAPQKA